MKEIKITVDEANGFRMKTIGADAGDILAVACALLNCLKEKAGMPYEYSLNAVQFALGVNEQGESSVKNPNEV